MSRRRCHKCRAVRGEAFGEVCKANTLSGRAWFCHECLDAESEMIRAANEWVMAQRSAGRAAGDTGGTT